MSDARPQWAGQRAMAWVIDDAPVPTALFPVLMVIARRCDEHGRGSYQSVPTIAEKTGKSTDQVKRDIRDLKKQGLLLPGDEALVAHFEPWKRPTVYDVPLHLSGPKPVRESKNKSGAAVDASTGGGMDAPGCMDATGWHSTRQGGGMDAPGGGGMDAPQTKPLNKTKNNPSLSARETEQPTADPVPTPRTERENEEAPPTIKNNKPGRRHSILTTHGLTDDEHQPFADWADQLPGGPKGDGWYIALNTNGTLTDRITDWRTSRHHTRPCPDCDDTGETGDWMNRRACHCLWWTNPGAARKAFIPQLAGMEPCAHGIEGGNMPSPNGWRFCAECRGPGWVDPDVKAGTEDRHTNSRYVSYQNPPDMAAYRDWSVLQTPRSLANRQEMAVSPGATLSANGRYLRMHDSHHPDRDYTEDF